MSRDEPEQTVPPVVNAVVIGCPFCKRIEDFQSVDAMQSSEWLVDVDLTDDKQGACPSCGVDSIGYLMALFALPNSESIRRTRKNMVKVLDEMKRRIDKQTEELEKRWREDITPLLGIAPKSAVYDHPFVRNLPSPSDSGDKE